MKQTPMFQAAKHPGIRSGFELAIRFHLWALRLGVQPDAEMVEKKFGVSRATGYRWASAYRTAAGGKYAP